MIEFKQLKGKRGRPKGPTEQGLATKERIYKVALEAIAEQGYDAATLREIAKRAHVSPGLLYKYFPNKRAIVLELSDQLSEQYAHTMQELQLHQTRKKWSQALESALLMSFEVLGPYRSVLSALKTTLMNNREDGLLSPERRQARLRVQRVFEEAISKSNDAPQNAPALGRFFYLLHLALILWWLLDRTSKQRATFALLKLICSVLPVFGLILKLPPAQRALKEFDQLLHEAIFDERVNTEKDSA